METQIIVTVDDLKLEIPLETARKLHEELSKVFSERADVWKKIAELQECIKTSPTQPLTIPYPIFIEKDPYIPPPWIITCSNNAEAK